MGVLRLLITAGLAWTPAGPPGGLSGDRCLTRQSRWDRAFREYSYLPHLCQAPIMVPGAASYAAIWMAALLTQLIDKPVDRSCHRLMKSG